MASGAPKAPEAPDPQKTAAAQTATNVSTAIANSTLGNVNQVTPYGNLTYSQTGSKFIDDPTGGSTYWKGPNGEYQTSAPMTTGPVTGGPMQKPVTTYEPGTGKKITTFQTVPGTTKTASVPQAGWTQVKGYQVPQYTATTTLSPEQQKILEQNNATELNLATIGNQQSQRLGSLLNTPFTLDGLPKTGAIPQYQQFQQKAGLKDDFADSGAITKSYGTDYASNVKDVENALFARANPQIDQQRASLETSLANRGIRQGSAAYASAMDDFNRGVNDQRTSILLSAGQEQSRLAGLAQNQAQFQNAAQQQQFGQDYARAGFYNDAHQQELANYNSAIANSNSLADRTLANQNQARATALNEQFALRNQPINEISALMSGSQVQNPNFVSTNMPQIANTDYAGLVQSNYQNQMAAYQQQMQSRSQLLGGIFGGVGSILAAPLSGGTSVLGGLFGR